MSCWSRCSEKLEVPCARNCCAACMLSGDNRWESEPSLKRSEVQKEMRPSRVMLLLVGIGAAVIFASFIVNRKKKKSGYFNTRSQNGHYTSLL